MYLKHKILGFQQNESSRKVKHRILAFYKTNWVEKSKQQQTENKIKL